MGKTITDKVLICHETPLKLIHRGRAHWNDYDYALVHLFEKYPEYYKFFEDSVKQGRHVILDNSIFELGKAFESEPFAKWIEKLQPTEYLVPDVLQNSQETINNFKNWKSNYNKLPGKKIGVVQGKSYEELVNCYNFMVNNADKIAISFDYDFYLQIGLGKNKWLKYADGRTKFLDMLINDNILSETKPLHLLGCAIPQEMIYYRHNGWYTYNIETLDTSNPVQQGLLGIRYTDDGLEEKNTLKIADSFETVYEDDKIEIANENVKKFRRFCNG